MTMRSSWKIPADRPDVCFDLELPGRFYPAGAPVVLPREHGEPLVIMAVTREKEPWLLGWNLASGKTRLEVSLGDSSLRAGPVAVDSGGNLLVSLGERSGLSEHVLRLDRQGRELARDSFRRPHFEDNPWDVYEATVDTLVALPGEAYALSWGEDDEPYDVGHTVRGLATAASSASGAGGRAGQPAQSGWVHRGNIGACVGAVLVGHRVARLDRVPWYRPIVGRLVADGAEQWSRISPERTHERLFEAAGGVLLVEDERRRLTYEGATYFPADTPSSVALLDAMTGATRWQRTFQGFIPSVLAGPEAVALIVGDHDGRGRLARLDAAGGLQWSRSRLDGAPSRGHYPNPHAGSWPRLVAFDDSRLVWYHDGWLRCGPASDPGVERWRLPCEGAFAQSLFVQHEEALIWRHGRRLVALCSGE